MSQEPIVPDELKEIEAALASLAPREARLDRERLIYLAGLAAGQEQAAQAQPPPLGPLPTSAPLASWSWPIATGVSTTLAMVLAAALFFRGEPPVEIRYVERPAPDVVAVTDEVIQVSEDPLATEAPAVAEAPRGERPSIGGVGGAFPWVERGSYFYIRELALRYGIDAVQFPESRGPTSSATYEELMQELAPGVGPPSGAGQREFRATPSGSGGVRYEGGVQS